MYQNYPLALRECENGLIQITLCTGIWTKILYHDKSCNH